MNALEQLIPDKRIRDQIPMEQIIAKYQEVGDRISRLEEKMQRCVNDAKAEAPGSVIYRHAEEAYHQAQRNQMLQSRYKKHLYSVMKTVVRFFIQFNKSQDDAPSEKSIRWMQSNIQFALDYDHFMAKADELLRESTAREKARDDACQEAEKKSVNDELRELSQDYKAYLSKLSAFSQELDDELLNTVIDSSSLEAEATDRNDAAQDAQQKSNDAVSPEDEKKLDDIIKRLDDKIRELEELEKQLQESPDDTPERKSDFASVEDFLSVIDRMLPAID